MITIYINNIKYNFPKKCTVEQVIGKRQLASVIKVWLNDDVVKKESYANIYVNESDRLRIKRIQHMT